MFAPGVSLWLHVRKWGKEVSRRTDKTQTVGNVGEDDGRVACPSRRIRRRIKVKNWLKWVSVILCVLVILTPAGCGTPAPAEEPTVAPTAPPAEPTTPAAEEPTAAPPEEGIPRGGTFVMGYSETPGANLNPYTGAGYTIFHPWQQPFLQGLVGWNPDGEPYPQLALEVPTLENGGVSADGKAITFNLRPDVKWADGQPFTCEDVRFTIESLRNPENILHSAQGIEYVDEVECPDDLTAVIKYKEAYAPWVTVPELVLPDHVLGQYPDMNDVPWNTEPFGTGPWMVTSHLPDYEITFEPNPYYWEMGDDGEPLPYLDKFVITFIPDGSVGMERFAAGEIDSYYYTEEDFLHIINTMPEGSYELLRPQGNDYAYTYLNLSPSSGPNMGDPAYPNPVLGDAKVRQAIDYAVDKPAIINTIRNGEGMHIATYIFMGKFAPDLEPRPYDPDKAKELLEEAGWTDTDGDGVRECHGCMYGEEGQRASLKLVGGAELKGSMLSMQIIQDNLKEVGFDAQVEGISLDLLWAPRDAGGLYTTGAFDIAWSGDKSTHDPYPQMFRDFHSSNADCPTLPWCTNWSRYVDEDMDELVEVAATEVDPAKRADMMDQIWDKVYNEVPQMFLHSRSRMAIIQPHIKGMTGPFDKANGFAWATNYVHWVYLEE